MARWGRGLSMKDFGKLFNVSAATVQRWESGNAKPSLVMFLMLCDSLDLKPLDYITVDREVDSHDLP